METILDKLTFQGNRILVEPIEEKKDSTIVTPDSAKPQTIHAKIIKLGNGENMLPGLKEGDMVIYERSHSTPMPIDDKPYFVINGHKENGVILATY